MELTPKEWMIASLVAEGLKNKEVADTLNMSEHVLKNKVKRIFDKLGFWNRTELALWYVKQTFRREDCK